LERTVDRLMADRGEALRRDLMFTVGQIYKQYTRPDVVLPKRHQLRSRETYELALATLRAHVPPDYRLYFEEPTVNERNYTLAERSDFEDSYRARAAETQAREE
jgi:hypothetical protein